MRLCLVVLLAIAGCDAGKKYQGRTARQWYEQAIDADPGVSLAGCKGLYELGKEGSPYLLKAMDEHKSRPLMQSTVIASLWVGNLSDEELARVAHYLDRKYTVDGGKVSAAQMQVMVVLRQAGPRAKKWLPQLRVYEKDPNHGSTATAAIKAIEKR